MVKYDTVDFEGSWFVDGGCGVDDDDLVFAPDSGDYLVCLEIGQFSVSVLFVVLPLSFEVESVFLVQEESKPMSLVLSKAPIINRAVQQIL